MSSNAPGDGAVLPLTEEQKLRAEKSVNLAEACARLKARIWYVEYDTLLSIAYEGLLKAAGKFDPAKCHNGEKGWEPFAVQHINWRLVRLQVKGTSEHSSNVRVLGRQMTEPDEKTLRAKVEEREDADDVAWEVRKRMRRLSPLERAVLTMRSRGFKLWEVAESLGRTSERVRQIEESARVKAARPIKRATTQGGIWSVLRWRAENPEDFRRKLRRAQRMGVKANVERARARRVYGRPYPRMFYVVDDTARTLTGPFAGRKEASGVTGQAKSKIGGAQHGWPTVMASQAEVLKVLEAGPSYLGKIAEALGAARGSTTTRIDRLRVAGLVVKAGKGPKGTDGPPPTLWALSDLARSLRREPQKVLRGGECEILLERGYRLLPADRLSGEQSHVEASGRESTEGAGVEAVGVPTGRASAEQLHEEVLRQARGGEGADRGGHGVS